jgi:hypothetical protein
LDEKVEGMPNVDVTMVMDDTPVLVELLDDVTRVKGVTVELLILTDVTAE